MNEVKYRKISEYMDSVISFAIWVVIAFGMVGAGLVLINADGDCGSEFAGVLADICYDRKQDTVMFLVFIVGIIAILGILHRLESNARYTRRILEISKEKLDN